MEKYCKTVNDYIAKGHARKVPDNQIDPGGKPLWYLPHHPVIHEHKPGKARVVFYCAARFDDTSLNDQLLQGPISQITSQVCCSDFGKNRLR